MTSGRRDHAIYGASSGGRWGKDPIAPGVLTGVDRDQVRDGFLWIMRFSWPRRFPIAQFPNLPLATAFFSGQIAAVTHGPAHADARAISFAAMTIWAYEELVHGVNWFRHLLGLYYVISTVAALALVFRH
jgi:hypothetical protein